MSCKNKSCGLSMRCDCRPSKNKKKPDHGTGKIKSLGGGWYVVNGEKVRGKDKAKELLKNDNS